MHWMGAHFCVCMFLDSRDKSLNRLKICRNNQSERKNKKRTKGTSLLRNPLLVHEVHSLASYCILPTGTKKVPQSDSMPQSFSEHI